MVRWTSGWHLRAALLGAALLSPVVAAAQPARVDDPDLVARGEYLMRAADCMPCHTGPDGRPFAGGLGLNTPFGVIYSSNITPDPTTGIGTWSYEDFRRALHDGIRADGAYLYPAMPYDAYTKIAHADVEALWAYFRSIEPVASVPPPNGLSFPFNVRLGMAFWRELYFSEGRFAPSPDRSTEFNRGAYLVEALGHCTDCHTPRTLLGGIEPARALTGAEVDHWFAPDISDDPMSAIGGMSVDELVTFLKAGSDAGKTTAFGPMAEVVHDSLAHLTEGDLHAMAVYLKELPPPDEDRRPPAARAMPPERYAAGQQLYIDNCLGCHQSKGVGAQGVAPALAGNTAVTAAEPYNPVMVVLEGIAAQGPWGAMPAFAASLGDQEVADLVNYVRTSWGNAAAPSATADLVATWRAAAVTAPIGDAPAAEFGCPDLASSAADPTTMEALAAELSSGDLADRTRELVARFKAANPSSSPADTVNTLLTAYCPTVAKREVAAAAKRAELRAFALRVAAVASPTGDGLTGQQPIVWAVPVGKTLTARWPAAQTGALSCPADVASQRALDGTAAQLLGRPQQPLDAPTVAALGDRLKAAAVRSPPADIANALISEYCRVVTALPDLSDAERRERVDRFGDQLIRHLQLGVTAAR